MSEWSAIICPIFTNVGPRSSMIKRSFFGLMPCVILCFRSTEIISLNLELFVPFSFSLISVFSCCLGDAFLFFPVFLADIPKVIVTFFFLEKAEKPLFGSFSDIFTLLLSLPQQLLHLLHFQHLPLYLLHPPLLLPNLRLTLLP